MKKVIIISGPTASGKSELALKLAQVIDAEIINADSFQVYKQLEIGVNKPSIEEMKLVKHHLINNIDVDQAWSIANFLSEAQKIIDNAIKNIIVIGGSTLYIDALINNYKLTNTGRTNDFNALSCEQLCEKINEIDAKLITNSLKNNHKRLTRMYENLLANNINQKELSKYEFFHIFNNIERTKLYEKINLRADQILNDNWANEVQQLAKKYDLTKHNAFKAIGYLPIYQNNFVIDENIKEEIKKQTRRYAKRQLTWCNNKFKFDFEYQNEIQLPLLLTLTKNWLAKIELPTSLYVHIPFCQSICTYCDFERSIYQESEVKQYLNNLIIQLKGIKQKQKTIYIGGGTPNVLNDSDLNQLLKAMQHLIDDDTEFSIELNSEFINLEQIKILKNNQINRISLGVQSLNDKILKKINRQHSLSTILEKIVLLKQFFDNISCDFIYNLPGMKEKDIDDIIEFIKQYEIKHLSFYALEIKENAILNKLGYQLDLDIESEQMLWIQTKLEQKTQFKRYEISNWAIDKKYYAKHNLVYWKMDQWFGIGFGSTGFYQNCYLLTSGNNLNYHYNIDSISEKQAYQDIIIMGLRMLDGLDLNDEKQAKAYYFFENELKPCTYKENNHIKVKQIDLLNEVLLKII